MTSEPGEHKGGEGENTTSLSFLDKPPFYELLLCLHLAHYDLQGGKKDLHYEKYICIKDTNHKLVQSSFPKPQLKPHESLKGSALCWNYKVLFINSSNHVFLRSVGLPAMVIVSLPTMIKTGRSCNGDPW